jgi:hypothetical protein
MTTEDSPVETIEARLADGYRTKILGLRRPGERFGLLSGCSSGGSARAR